MSRLSKTGYHPLNGDDYGQLHEASLNVLEKTGIQVEDPIALEIFDSYGASIDPKTGVTRFPPAMVEDAIRSAPHEIKLSGLIPKHDIVLDRKNSFFANFSGNIRVYDPDQDTVRESTKADLAAAARLCDALDEVSVFSRAVYPLDQPSELMHLHTAEACLLNTNKHCIHGPESGWETEKIIAMVEAAVGGADNLVCRKPVTFVASITSPLKMTRTFSEVAITSANKGFSTSIATAVMAGGNGPVDLAGTLVLTNAEILAGIVLTQLVNKGAPVIYGSYSTGMDLKFCTSPMGSPEAAMIAACVAGLCRYYGLPCQVPGIASDGKRPGIQAAVEKSLTGLTAALAGANLIFGIGGIESGLTFDFGQAVLDTEIMRSIMRIRTGIDINTDTLSTDIIHDIGCSGNYLTHTSTFQHMRSLSQTEFFNRSGRRHWESMGKPQSYQRALLKARDILKKYRPEPLSDSSVKQIRDIMNEAEKKLVEMKKIEGNPENAVSGQPCMAGRQL